MCDNQTDRSGSFYSFGETTLAAERLRVISEVFDPISEAFVSETVRTRPRLALDLVVLQLWRLDLISGLLRYSDVTCPIDFRTVQVAPV